MYVEVSREEWLSRGLAIAMVLAMVGMAVLPMIYGCKVGTILWMYWRPHNALEAFRNGIISGVAGYVIRTAVVYILEDAIEGAEIGSIAGPVGLIAGIVGGAL